jgi:DNA-binding PadR family transcriptional regulator
MELSPTAKVVLGMIALGERTGYDIKRTVERSTAFFWGASFGQIYPELARLEAAGLISGSSRGVRGRKEYELMAGGRRALREWLASPEPQTFSFRSEGLLKAFFGDLAPLEDRLANARRVVEWNERVLALFREIEAEGSTAEALAYGLEFIEWNLGWWKRHERRLKARARARPRPGISVQRRR